MAPSWIEWAPEWLKTKVVEVTKPRTIVENIPSSSNPSGASGDGLTEEWMKSVAGVEEEFNKRYQEVVRRMSSGEIDVEEAYRLETEMEEEKEDRLARAKDFEEWAGGIGEDKGKAREEDGRRIGVRNDATTAVEGDEVGEGCIYRIGCAPTDQEVRL